MSQRGRRGEIANNPGLAYLIEAGYVGKDAESVLSKLLEANSFVGKALTPCYLDYVGVFGQGKSDVRQETGLLQLNSHMLGGGSQVKYWFICLAAIIYKGCEVVTSCSIAHHCSLLMLPALYTFPYTNLQIAKAILFICGGAFVGREDNLRKEDKSEVRSVDKLWLFGLRDSANEYTDDDDVSWKVRRAAAKCLAALVVTQPEMLSKLYRQACSKLIDKFKERKSKLSPIVLDTSIYAVTSHANCYTQGLRESVIGK
ncbi:hypothetical protein R3W88_003666 [Solanum pinnatisectum]|uniref:Uncharacterized protein n=1 Tax=Solanum pinnatisectum TaxID=50273 RepID=A0AAV9MSI0_9SOLN|nr:hypothetical protein R3W88_003666 [Solanum pinnatisectum]